jgi:ABC-type lipoprotein export system ATPase subunit
VPELLRAEAISKTWDAAGPVPVHAVREVSLVVAAGEAVVVSGPSGSGKTTLLCMLGALLRPDRGRVVLDGVDLSAAPEALARRVRLERIGFVFQRGLLLANLTVRDNLAIVAHAAGVPRREARARAEGLLARLGLVPRAHLRPAALSAGECQRVALARALVLGPRLVLADEPTAHLDSATGERVVAELRALTAGAGAGLVVVTHDPRVAAIGDRVLALEDGRLRAP